MAAGDRRGPIVADRPARRVLVVDEAGAVRAKLVNVLEEAEATEVEVVTAGTAAEGLAHLRAQLPRVVFTDLAGDSPEAGLRTILEVLKDHPALPIVLVTAEPRESPLVREAVRMGVFAVLHKPLRNDAIRAVVAELETEESGVARFVR